MAREISQLHPRLQQKIAQLRELCEKEGLALGIGECFRSVQEQDALYAQGRTEPGAIVTNAPGSSYSSQHQWGIAFDFYKNVSGHAYDDDAFFARVGALGKSVGLGWGGDWQSIVDRPHLYLPDWGSTPGPLKQQYGTFERFRATWGDAGNGEGDEGDSAVWQASGTATCTGDRVNYRTGPGTSYTVLGQLNKGNRFEVNGAASGDWVQMKTSGIVGWISANYVKYDGAAAGSGDAGASTENTSQGKKALVEAGQIHCNNFCGAALNADGIRGAATVKGGIMALQQAMNLDYGAGLSVDGIWGSRTEAALGGHTVRLGEVQYMVTALQILLLLKGYDPNGVESPGSFGGGCRQAVIRYQSAVGLDADGIAGYHTFRSLTA